jgi:hypothetical protein
MANEHLLFSLLEFVPGIHNEEGVFVPGMTKKIGKEIKFFPGISVETKQGIQFCEGYLFELF